MFAACQCALPHLRKTKGNIINMSSLVGAMGQLTRRPTSPPRAASRPSPRRWRSTRRSTTCGSTPSRPATSGRRSGRRRSTAAPDPSKCRADGDAAQLLGRMGTIEEAGRLCLFLAAEATFTTGVDHILSGAPSWRTAVRRGAAEPADRNGSARLLVPYARRPAVGTSDPHPPRDRRVSRRSGPGGRAVGALRRADSDHPRARAGSSWTAISPTKAGATRRGSTSGTRSIPATTSSRRSRASAT